MIDSSEPHKKRAFDGEHPQHKMDNPLVSCAKEMEPILVSEEIPQGAPNDVSVSSTPQNNHTVHVSQYKSRYSRKALFDSMTEIEILEIAIDNQSAEYAFDVTAFAKKQAHFF